MAYTQAPKIKYNGEKNRDKSKMGKAIRTHELEMAIMCGLGDRDFAAMKIMLFLTGNAEGFGVAEKTICERCNISESAYKTARKKLIDKGWLTLLPAKEIIVNYDNIYNSIEGYSDNTSSEEKINDLNKGYSQNTSKGYSEYTSKRYSQNTYNNISNNINNSQKEFVDYEASASPSQILSSENRSGGEVEFVF